MYSTKVQYPAWGFTDNSFPEGDGIIVRGHSQDAAASCAFAQRDIAASRSPRPLNALPIETGRQFQQRRGDEWLWATPEWCRDWPSPHHHIGVNLAECEICNKPIQHPIHKGV